MFLMLFGMRALDGGLYVDKVDAKCDPDDVPDGADWNKENCIYKK